MYVLVISDYRNLFVVVNFNLAQPTVLQNPLRRSRNVILCPYLVFQDLLIITNKEILNSDNSRELSRLTFQDDMEKILILFLL